MRSTQKKQKKGERNAVCVVNGICQWLMLLLSLSLLAWVVFFSFTISPSLLLYIKRSAEVILITYGQAISFKRCYYSISSTICAVTVRISVKVFVSVFCTCKRISVRNRFVQKMRCESDLHRPTIVL